MAGQQMPDGLQVAVAVYADDGDRGGGRELPGFDDASGRHVRSRRHQVLEKSEEAVRVATEAIAAQIGVTAQRMAASIEQQSIATPAPGQLGLESVEVSFGITLTGGVQALFTAQAESSAQVTITLTRRPQDTASGPA